MTTAFHTPAYAAIAKRRIGVVEFGWFTAPSALAINRAA